MQEEFILFGSQHISALSTVIAVSVATPIVLRTANNNEVKKICIDGFGYSFNTS